MFHRAAKKILCQKTSQGSADLRSLIGLAPNHGLFAREGPVGESNGRRTNRESGCPQKLLWRSCWRLVRARACDRPGPRSCTRSPDAPCWRTASPRSTRRGSPDVALVVGPGREDVAALAPLARRFHTRAERRGTAHAVLAAEGAIAEGMRRAHRRLRRYAAHVVPETFAGPALPELRSRKTARPSPCSASRRADPKGYGRLHDRRRQRSLRFARRETRAPDERVNRHSAMPA